VYGDQGFSAYALLDVPGGVVASEWSGYADPTNDAFCRLSQGGRSSAVVRSNIQAHYRFGCARDGALLFDDDEYVFIDDLDRVPSELRGLFELAWDDLEGDVDDMSETSPVAVALAMAEVVTGLELTAEHLSDLMSATFYRSPSLIYRG
jgi:hypothetical protein